MFIEKKIGGAFGPHAFELRIIPGGNAVELTITDAQFGNPGQVPFVHHEIVGKITIPNDLIGMISFWLPQLYECDLRTF